MRIHTPQSIAEAMSMRKELPEAPFFAGGTVVYALGHSYDDAIDISKAVGSEIFHTMRHVHIGAMASLEKIRLSELSPKVLRDAASFCPSLQQRNAATIGGNAAQRRDDGYLTAALLASDPTVVLMTEEGKAEATVSDYLAGRADGLILEFVFRKNLPGEARRIGRSSHAHMAVSGARVGDAYAYTASSSGFASGGKDCWQELGFKDDLLGSADYKRYLLSVMF